MNKHYLIILICLNFIYSCTNYKEISQQENKQKREWVKAFKQRVFYECLKSSYTNDSIFKSIRKEDFFDTSDYLTFKSIDKAKEVAFQNKKMIPKWIAHCDDCDSIVYKKPIFSSCLDLYTSVKLDSIANSEYNKK